MLNILAGVVKNDTCSVMHYRSQLFVPGNRPDRYEKACQSGADLICIDLEDSVAPSEKEDARAAALDWLEKNPHGNVSLRINGLDTNFGQEDVDKLKSCGLSLPFVMLPKVSSKKQIVDLDKNLPDALGPFFAIIESTAGLLNCEEIFSADRIKLGMYGAIDYANEVDCDLSWDAHLYSRSRLVAAAMCHNVQLFDAPHINIRDLDDCEASTRKAKQIGIHARSAVHPAQIDRIHRALAPTPEEIRYAESIMAAYENANGNVVLLDGAMVEAPIIKRAERILKFK